MEPTTARCQNRCGIVRGAISSGMEGAMTEAINNVVLMELESDPLSRMLRHWMAYTTWDQWQHPS